MWQDEAETNAYRQMYATKEDTLDEFIEYAHKNKGRKISPKNMVKERIESATVENRKSRALQVEQLKKDYPKWMNNCHHASCLDILDSLESESVDVIWADVPYAQYYKEKNGKYADPESKGLETACDANTRDEALELTKGIIDKAERVLKPNGKIVLFQAASEPDRPEIITKFRDNGFEAIIPRYWKKGQCQPGDFQLPFSHETERILLAARNRESFQGLFNGKGRTDILTDEIIKQALNDDMEYFERPVSRVFYNEVRHGEVSYGDRHFFEKPLNLCKFYLGKLTHPADMVVDVCGCTGSMVQACIEMDRRWIYCETHETNYNLGVSRISEVMERFAGIKSEDDDASVSA